MRLLNSVFRCLVVSLIFCLIRSHDTTGYHHDHDHHDHHHHHEHVDVNDIPLFSHMNADEFHQYQHVTNHMVIAYVGRRAVPPVPNVTPIDTSTANDILNEQFPSLVTSMTAVAAIYRTRGIIVTWVNVTEVDNEPPLGRHDERSVDYWVEAVNFDFSLNTLTTPNHIGGPLGGRYLYEPPNSDDAYSVASLSQWLSQFIAGLLTPAIIPTPPSPTNDDDHHHHHHDHDHDHDHHNHGHSHTNKNYDEIVKQLSSSGVNILTSKSFDSIARNADLYVNVDHPFVVEDRAL
jgi:hypothetical protein